MRKSTTSALGVVAHRLTELVLKGAAPSPSADRRAWLTDQWESLLHAEWKSIQDQWSDRTVEAPKHWPGEVVTRVRLIKRLQGLEVSAHGTSSMTTSSVRGTYAGQGRGPALPWIERKLYDKARGLFGQPDRVEEVKGILRVVDLKSGVQQSEMTAPQLQQLLLYAHLVSIGTGRLPNQVVVQNVKGNETACTVSPVAVEDVVEQAVTARKLFNEAVSNHIFSASPSEAACRFCQFRVICADYWGARDDDWQGGAVRGTVMSVGIDGVALAPIADSSSGIRLIGQGTQNMLEGEEIVAVDLMRAGPGVFRTRWNSGVRRGAQTQ